MTKGVDVVPPRSNHGPSHKTPRGHMARPAWSGTVPSESGAGEELGPGPVTSTSEGEDMGPVETLQILSGMFLGPVETLQILSGMFLPG